MTLLALLALSRVEGLLLAAQDPPPALRLPQLFSDHMVLQRDVDIPVWGEAAPGEDVRVAFGTSKATTRADARGRWMLRLGKSTANAAPQTLTVTGKTTIEFRDVLVGDVWLCAGQSNMGMYLGECHNADTVVPASTDPLLRLFRVAERVSAKPELDVQLWNGRRWLPSSPDAANPFSGTAWFFGRELRNALKIPIGLINSSQGGSMIQLWTSPEAVEKNADADPDFRGWLSKRKDVLAAHPAQLPEGREYGPYSSFMVGNLYHAMIAPLRPFAIKGIAWYQGESNEANAKQYRSLLPILIADWRAQWGQGDLPFVFVQLPNIRPPADAPVRNDDKWPWIREAQAKALALPRTAMAVTIDIGDPNEVHGKDKMDVGIRLALAARRLAYGETLVSSGPMFRGLSVEGSTAWLDFDHVGGGLIIGAAPWVPSGPLPLPGKDLSGFALAGADKVWHPAKARIEKNRVALTSDRVPRPVAVRYGWADNPACNLYNAEKLPAAPFRSDDW